MIKTINDEIYIAKTEHKLANRTDERLTKLLFSKKKNHKIPIGIKRKVIIFVCSSLFQNPNPFRNFLLSFCSFYRWI